VVTVTAAPVMTALTASQAVFTTAGKALTSNAITGTGNVVMSASPTLTGTISAAAATLSGNLTLSGGTANGVLYLDGSKVATSGSALTFDGTNLAISTGKVTTSTAGASAGFQWGGTTTTSRLYDDGSGNAYLDIGVGASNSSVPLFIRTKGASGIVYVQPNGVNAYVVEPANQIWYVNGTRSMDLTSTGLGIGTSSPGSYSSRLVSVSQAGGAAQSLDAPVGTNTALNWYYNGTAKWTTQVLTTGEFRFFDFTAAATRLTIDNAGNLGLGVTPSAWNASYKAFQNAGGALVGVGTGEQALLNNAYIAASGNYTYINTAAASRYSLSAGAHYWFTAPSGTAGNAISFTQALTLDASGNLLLNGTSAPASSAGNLVMFNGTAPTGNVTNGCTLFCEDVSSSSELKVRDEAGNVTTLSPHNFSLIPEGPSEDMAWSYYSERDGRRINIDMLKAIRLLEKLSGEQLVYEA
jgi:hypothetical protein